MEPSMRNSAVSIPFNGEAAIEAVLARYHVRWLAIFGLPRSGGRSRAALGPISSGAQTSVGRFRLEPVPLAGVSALLYRVQSPTRTPLTR
jgi:hypothetical protein